MIAASFVKPACVRIGVGDDDAHAALVQRAAGLVRKGEQPGAEAEAAELRANREHIHVPGAGRQILQLLERHEHIAGMPSQIGSG